MALHALRFSQLNPGLDRTGLNGSRFLFNFNLVGVWLIDQ